MVDLASLVLALWVYTTGPTLKVASDDGTPLLSVSPIVWSANWGWTGLEGRFQPAPDGTAGTFIGRLQPGDVPCSFQITLRRIDARTLGLAVRFSVERDTELTQAVLAIEPARGLSGAGGATVVDDAGERTLDVPLGRGDLSDSLRRLSFKASSGVIALHLAAPTPAGRDGAARLVLASGRVRADQPREVSLTLSLPQDATFALTSDDVPEPDNWAEWFEWRGTADTAGASAIDMRPWLDAPAGRHGWVTRDGASLVYNGRPIRFWGVNASFANCAPPRDRADRQAAFYAKYGINAVRLHKYADGRGWAGILRNGATDFDPEAQDRMDYFVARLRQAGIYTKLSSNFGSLKLGPADDVPFKGELRADRDGWAEAPQGALWFSDELQSLQIGQVVEILNRTNPHTGLRYADDPAVLCVEAVNENSLYFFTTLATLQNVPTIRQRAGEQFARWLRERYPTEADLERAWGSGGLNTFRDEGFADESFVEGRVYPVGNPWFFDPTQLEGSQRHRKQRLLDTMVFMHEVQSAFYRRFEQAVRATGYRGLIVGSNWQAGRAISHYLNLHTDSLLDVIDRHNYFGGSASMLASPGSGMLSAGMQQVDDHPFMLSEWIHTFPSEFALEGPALIGAYGMGLNGWDVSYMFQNGDEGRFRQRLGEEWDVVAPQVLGIFPAVARQVHRGDVKTSDLVFARNLHVDSLKQGVINFDDRVVQGYDDKSFDTDAVPAASLAVGRSVARFVDSPQPTQRIDLRPHIRDDAFVSSTGQLAWRLGRNPRDGHVTIDTPGTQAVVGFASGRTIQFADVAITPATPFCAVYVSAIDPDDSITSADRLLITTLARVRNTGQKLIAGDLIARGDGPMRVEPVSVDVRLRRSDRATVHILDHDGRRTGKTVDLHDGTLRLEGRETRAIYYEVVYE